MLYIPLYRDARPHHEPKRKGEPPLGTPLSEKPFPFFNRLVARGVCPFGMDPQHAAHAAYVKRPRPSQCLHGVAGIQMENSDASS